MSSHKKHKRIRSEESSIEEEPMDSTCSSQVENANLDNTTFQNDTMNISNTNTDTDDEDLLKDQLIAECGTIQKIVLHNFMCHRFFELNLSPRVNFVIGKNGSGKSAILAGIVIALGGKMSSTQRGTSMTSLIKTGENAAKVILHLCNDNGYNRNFSYKYEEYGRTVIVERLLRADGPSTYTLKSYTSRIISRKKEDLNDMLRHFDIQITNPVCVLSQDMSRNFLNSKNPKDKYDFFMKATNLDKLKENYVNAKDQNSLAQDKLALKKLLVPDLKRELKELEHKVRLLTRFNEYQQKHMNLCNEQLWATVNREEKVKEQLLELLQGRDNRIQMAKSTLEQFDTQEKKNELRRVELEQQVQKILEECSQLDKKLDEIKDECKLMRPDVCDKEMALKLVESELAREKCNGTALDRQLFQLRKQFEHYEKYAAEREQREIRKKELEENREIYSRSIAELTQKKNSLEILKGEIEEKMSQERSMKIKLSSSIQQKQREIQSLEGSKSNDLRRFGEHMPGLVAAIERAFKSGQFKKKPYGPLGSYIRVKEKELALPIEAIIGGTLHAFCCDNQEDAQVLAALFRRHVKGRTPAIFTRTYVSRWDVSGMKVCDTQYRTLFDFVEIKEDVVFNIIEEMVELESILYIPNHQTAVNFLIKPENVPRNCKQSVSSDGSLVYPKRGESNFRSYVNDRMKVARFLVEDVTETIQQLKIDLTKSRLDYEDFEKRLKQTESDFIKMRSDFEELETELNKKIQKLKTTVQLLNEMTNSEVREPIEITALEEDMLEHRRLVDAIEKKKEQKLKEFNEIAKKYKEKERKAIDLSDEIQQRLANKRPIQNEMNEILEAKNQSLQKKQAFRNRLMELEKKQKEERLKIQDVEENVNLAMEAAKKHHQERIETNRTPEDIENEAKALEEFLKESQKSIGDSERILEEYESKKRCFERLMKQIQFFVEYLNDFEKTLSVRSKSYINYRNFISNQVEIAFKSFLSMLNFNGFLKVYHVNKVVDGVSHNEKTLEIKVNPKSGDLAGSYSDSRSLSGGERSFSTIAFLLALWHFCTSPFNVLDEIDVFMDMITRHLALDALIESANTKFNRQYIFLSPLPPEKKSVREMLNIYYMPEPERGTSTS